MNVLERVVDYVSSITGVIKVTVLDKETSLEIRDIERSVRTRTNHTYKNVGYDMAMDKKYRLCVFFVKGYIFEKRTILKLVTEDGTIMGTTITSDQSEEYRGRDDVILVSDDFAVFPNVIGKGEESFVLYPFDIPEIEKNVAGCKKPIGVSPTPSTDAFIKTRNGMSLTDRIFTSIIAFDD
ncbi:MAG: hypothetical protein MJY64_02035 [archaeon]|nr:hypothetical protein [archaeon]